jgi:hypothetical protein
VGALLLKDLISKSLVPPFWLLLLSYKTSTASERIYAGKKSEGRLSVLLKRQTGAKYPELQAPKLL